MASKSAQTHAKRARELAVKEKRERKQAKKAEAAGRRAAGGDASLSELGPDDSAAESAGEGAAEVPSRDAQ